LHHPGTLETFPARCWRKKSLFIYMEIVSELATVRGAISLFVPVPVLHKRSLSLNLAGCVRHPRQVPLIVSVGDELRDLRCFSPDERL